MVFVLKVESVEGDSIEILLRQLGAAKIQKVSGYLYFIKFILDDDFEVMYTYNINAKKQFFLQRIEPYPLPQGAFSDEKKLVTFIKQDLKKFRRCQKTKYFELFLETAINSHTFLNKLNNIYLNNEINDCEDTSEILKEINNDLEKITSKLYELKKYSK